MCVRETRTHTGLAVAAVLGEGTLQWRLGQLSSRDVTSFTNRPAVPSARAALAEECLHERFQKPNSGCAKGLWEAEEAEWGWGDLLGKAHGHRSPGSPRSSRTWQTEGAEGGWVGMAAEGLGIFAFTPSKTKKPVLSGGRGAQEISSVADLVHRGQGRPGVCIRVILLS